MSTKNNVVNKTSNYQMQLEQLHEHYPQLGSCPACNGRGAVLNTSNQIMTCPNCWGTSLFGMNFQQVAWFQQALKAVRFVKRNPWAASRPEYQRTCQMINSALSRYGIDMPSVPWEEKLKKLAADICEVAISRLYTEVSRKNEGCEFENDKALLGEVMKQVEEDKAAANPPAKPKRARKPRKAAVQSEPAVH